MAVAARGDRRRWPGADIRRTVPIRLRAEGNWSCHAPVTLVLGKPPPPGCRLHRANRSRCVGDAPATNDKEESMLLVLNTANFLKRCAGLSMMRHQAGETVLTSG